MSDIAAPHPGPPPTEMQYVSASHQADTALDGMWLFLATEMLFFGGVLLIWLVDLHAYPVAFALAGRHTNLWIGATNTLLLLASSLSYALALECARIGSNRNVARLAAVTVALGLAFLALKGIEWRDDLRQHLFPGPGFAITGAPAGGAQLFFCLYFIATGLHGIHMIAGVALVGWVGWQGRRGLFSPEWHTPAAVVGLYWSFVDMVWLVLFPLIYLTGRS
jgi:cytochrome c oxidase subunit 3